jgi:hypothetical protein
VRDRGLDLGRRCPALEIPDDIRELAMRIRITHTHTSLRTMNRSMRGLYAAWKYLVGEKNSRWFYREDGRWKLNQARRL